MNFNIFNRQKIADGVFFNAIQETKFKSNLISVRFIVPLDESTAAKNALLFPVLLRGSKNFPDIGAIRREEESVYDTDISDGVYKRGDTQILEMRMRVLDNRFSIDGMDITARAVHLLSDVLFAPVMENGIFLADYVESEKQMLVDDIRAQINDKRRYAMQRLMEEMFSDDVFGISELGTVESVCAITPESLTVQYQDLLSRARVEIFAVGNFDFDSLGKTFAKSFASLQRKNIVDTETCAMQSAKETVKTVYERQNISQGKLSLGFYTGVTVRDPNYTAMQLLNIIYGAGVTSKLFLNVREKLSLCYYCGSGDNGQKGFMTVHSGIEFKNEKKAADEILAQLEEIKKGNISENELRDAKLALIDSAERIADSAINMLNWYFACVMNEAVITPKEKCEAIRAVKTEEIVKIAQNIRLDTYYFLCAKEETI
ncbi:MAG: insulinase family protein [Ruminococcaceae bacterium]|nr:insulinase family protein [Oscillospiraceae bacterium]